MLAGDFLVSLTRILYSSPLRTQFFFVKFRTFNSFFLTLLLPPLSLLVSVVAETGGLAE